MTIRVKYIWQRLEFTEGMGKEPIRSLYQDRGKAEISMAVRSKTEYTSTGMGHINGNRFPVIVERINLIV